MIPFKSLSCHKCVNDYMNEVTQTQAVFQFRSNSCKLQVYYPVNRYMAATTNYFQIISS